MTDDDTLGTGLAYKARLPFTWARTEPAVAGVHEENEKNLRVVLAMSEYPPEHSDEYALLDFKLNIALELLADLLAQQKTLPPPVEVTLGADSLSWQAAADNRPESGDEIVVSLYLSPSYPRPLILHGVAQRCTDELCKMTFAGQPEGVQMMLEKFIFLHHRRQIAQARHHENS